MTIITSLGQQCQAYYPQVCGFPNYIIVKLQIEYIQQALISPLDALLKLAVVIYYKADQCIAYMFKTTLIHISVVVLTVSGAL